MKPRSILISYGALGGTGAILMMKANAYVSPSSEGLFMKEIIDGSYRQ